MAAKNRNPGVTSINVPDILDSLNSGRQEVDNNTVLSIVVGEAGKLAMKFFDHFKRVCGTG
ncbi:MAG: hypothetical protein IGS39_23125 [Calothrix sp. C42_A2020_038]|nr:hypothetical protein [Calothrix sp. C42_A2020_038]